MQRLTITITILAGLPILGCAADTAPDLLDDDGLETGATEDGGWDPPESEHPGPDIPHPDRVPIEPDPDGRITSVSLDGADLVVTVSLVPAVTDIYPEADHYALRLDADREYVVAGLIDGAGQTLEDMRFTWPEPGTIVADFPEDDPPPAAGCAAEVCAWDVDWPSPGLVYDHLRISDGPERVLIEGTIGGAALQRDLMIDPITQELTIEDHAFPADISRLEDVTVLLDDLAAVMPEVVPLDDCLWCSAGAVWMLSRTGLCVAGFYLQCKDAQKGAKEFAEECGGACAP